MCFPPIFPASMSEGHQSHQSGKLKQANKKHKKIGHSSKRGVDRKNALGGRVVGKPVKNNRKKFPTKDIEGQGRANRLNRARQISNERRKHMLLKRRFGAGSNSGAPKILCILGLGHTADELAYQIRTLILGTADRTPHDAIKVPGFASTMLVERFKSRFTVLTPPSSDSVAVLDAAKVADVLVVVVEASNDASTYTNNLGVDNLCCLRAQGLPNVVGVQVDLSALPKKQRGAGRKLGLRFFETELGANSKVVDVERGNAQGKEDVALLLCCSVALLLCCSVALLLVFFLLLLPSFFSKSADHSAILLFLHLLFFLFPFSIPFSVQTAASALLCRIFSETPSKDLTFRKCRSYMLVDDFVPVPATLDNGQVIHGSAPGTDLRVSGYVRGVPLNVNSLVHLTGIGTYRLRRIEHAQDPHPRKIPRNGAAAATKKMAASNILAVADSSLQDSLVQTAEPDQLMGEQSFISDAELQEADLRYDPATGGKVEELSIHQAWIQAAKDAIRSRAEHEEAEGLYMDDDEDMEGGGGLSSLLQSRFGDVSDDDDDDDDEPVLGALDGRGNPIGRGAASLYAPSELGDMEVDEDDDDRNKSAAEVREEAMRMRERRQEDDVRFPDEVDTPIDVPALLHLLHLATL